MGEKYVGDETDHTRAYQFGDWLIEPHLNRISRGDEEKQLEPKAMDVLACLLENAGEVVSSRELLDRVWSDRVVEEGAVHQRISKIRRALGDHSHNPQYIESIPRRGYRTKASVKVKASDETETADDELLARLEAFTPPFAAYDGDGPYVFVCYAHADRAAIYPEVVRVRDAGVNVWYDEGISPGSEWTEEIGNAIADCSQFLYYISPTSVASRNCRDELQFALKRGKPMVTVYIEPTDLAVGLDLSIGSTQALLRHEIPDADYWRKLSAALDVEKTLSKLSTVSNVTVEAQTGMQFKKHYRAVIALAVVGVLGVLGWATLRAFDTSTETPLTRSVMVMPFEVMGLTSEATAIVGDVATEISGILSGYQELQTLSRSETAQAPEPSYLVTGSVQASAMSVSVRVQLTRGSDGVGVWSKAYDQQLRIDLSNWRDLALTISRNVRMQLVIDHECEGIKRKTVSASAAEYTWAGLAVQYGINQGEKTVDWELVRSYGQRAIDLDPGLAAPYLLLSLYNFNDETPFEEGIQLTRDAIENAVRLEPSNPVWIWWLGKVQMWSYRYDIAERNFLKAIELDPLSPWVHWFYESLGELEVARGNLIAAEAHYERAVRLNDADSRVYSSYTRLLNIMNKPDKALRVADTGLELVKGTSYYNMLVLQKLNALRLMDKKDAAVEFYARAKPSSPVASVYAGDLDEARLRLAASEDLGTAWPGTMLYAYALLGEKDLAFEWAGRHFDRPNGFYDIQYLRTDPSFDNLRDDPRWTALIKRLEELENRESAAK